MVVGMVVVECVGGGGDDDMEDGVVVMVVMKWVGDDGKDGVWRASAVGGCGGDGDGVGLEMMTMVVGDW
ncbi:hypothetical protein Tco_0824877 [Tanacetum coccineum]